MINKDYTILAAHGLHARPATELIKLVKGFRSVISLKKGEKVVRLHSILNILSLALKGGDSITIVIDGEDETAAANAIDHFFTQRIKDL